MKKSAKLISLLLAVMMVVALMPTMALADEDVAENSVSDIIGSVVNVINGIEIPDYLVYCSLSGRMPASGAQIVINDQFGLHPAKAYTANSLGLALISKGLVGVYNVSATCNGPVTGVKYSTIAGTTWTLNAKVEVEELTLYPVLNIGLNYSDHFSYMVGYGDGTVRPDGNVTRAEVASMILRLMTNDSRDKFFTKTNSFSDVKAGAWYNSAVSTLANAGVINGYKDGTFRPDQNITRAEFSAMIGRMFSTEYVGSPIFGDTNGHWAEDFISLLAKLGIINGDENGNANPDANLTRAEAAAMCNRLLGRSPDEHSADSCNGEIIVFKDCSAGQWYYADMTEATNSHNYTWSVNLDNVLDGSQAAVSEQWTNIRTDTPNWTELQK